MEVRLAYEQGLFRGRNLSPFQRWGLSYYVYMQRRQYMDDVRQIQELQTFELNFERWKQLHAPNLTEKIGGESYDAVTEYYPSEIDEFLAGVESGAVREMSGYDLDDAGLYGMEV